LNRTKEIERKKMTDNNRPTKHMVSASAIIPARRERVYALLADYQNGHPRILPKQFTSLVVEQGGIGAGTIIRVEISFLGKKQTLRMAVAEPEPGRVLVETSLEPNGPITTFTVNPGTAPADSHVTISTEITDRGGLLGKIEGLLSKFLLRSIYEKELENLARVATGPFAG
jgi:hypothetical protein